MQRDDTGDMLVRADDDAPGVPVDAAQLEEVALRRVRAEGLARQSGNAGQGPYPERSGTGPEHFLDQFMRAYTVVRAPAGR